MNIYKLEQTELTEYAGFYTSCIVVAESEEEAKKIHPNSNIYKGSGLNSSFPWAEKDGLDYRVDDWANDLNNVEVTLLGIAEPNLNKGVIFQLLTLDMNKFNK